MRPRHLLPIVALLGLTACVSPGATISGSRVAADYAGNARTILVVTNLRPDRILPNFDETFTPLLAGELQRCGVAAQVVRAGGITPATQPDPTAFDATLLIAPSRVVNYVTNGTTTGVRTIYVATLVDRATRRDVWKAEFTLNRGFRNTQEAAVIAAQGLVGRMGSDHVLRSCPPSAAAPSST